MPVVDIEVVVPPDVVTVAGLAQALADAIGDTLGSAPGQTWVRLQLLPTGQYAENHASLGAADLRAFVRLLQRQPAEGDRLDMVNRRRSFPAVRDYWRSDRMCSENSD